MMSPPLVSICIPTYNRPDYLQRAVASCLAQTMRDFEVVITDNSTNDESAKRAESWTDPRIRYHRNDGNIGAVASSNRAVSLSKGRYIKFLMDDDLLKPRCLELMAGALEKHPTAGVAMAPMDLVDDTDKRIFPRFYIFQKMHYRYRYQVGDALIGRKRLLKDFLTRDYPCTVPSGIMFRAEALRKAGPFSTEADFAGDLEMCMKLAADWDFYYVDEVLSSWRLMPSCHTASLHQTGLKIHVFYNLTRQCLDNPSVKTLFADDWERTLRDSMFFCSCRALLNGLAGIRSRSPRLVFRTIKTIMHEDRYVYNWLRLPIFVLTRIFSALFPPHTAPPREG